MDDDSGQLVDLLRQARGGDDTARDELFDKCRAYVSLVARAQVQSWLRTKVDASDLVQQTLLEAHRGFDGFRGETEAEWLAWLRRILSHNATDFVRHYYGTEKRQARREIPLRAAPADRSFDFVFEPSAPDESPSQLVMQREREIQVADAISELSEDYQEVIMLRNLQRLPFNQVAKEMGRSRPAVQMLWLRALRRLQEVLESKYPADQDNDKA